MKWLKVAICSIIIIVIVLIIVLMVLLNNINKSMPERENKYTEIEPIENANIEMVSNRDEYYTIKYILQTYFRYINYIDANAEDLQLSNIPNQEEIIQNYTKTAIESLKKIIDKDYFKQNQTDEQIKKNLASYKNKSFRISKLYSQDKTIRKTVYFAYVTLDYNKEMKIIIKLDSISDSFTILPEDYINKNNYLESSLNQIEVDNIVSNDINKYEYIRVTNEMMVSSYLEDYGNITLNNIQKSYELLDEEYKKYKFTTLAEYSNYIKNSKKDYEMIRAVEYNVNNDGTIYTCKDQYGNIYVFKGTSIMDYTVQLDDYTLENEEFNKKYNKVENRDKGLLNVDKFFKMINMQDYKTAYSVLDNNFKQNYFKTQEEFENYMKNKTFLYNEVEYKEYSNKITGIYNYKVVLTDKTKENSNQQEFNIVMKLLEGTDFVMSFTIN